jgi:RNA polymerase subunit RPABC4/transcription elongation factor Spt4
MRTDSSFTNPAVHPFVECPSCKRLITPGVESCPHCREPISAEYAQVSAAIVVFNTAACSSANTIKTAEYAAVVVFVATLLGILLVAPSLAVVNVFNSIVSIAAILLWFRRFGRFRFGDAEYGKAKRDMRISLILWTVLIVVQVLAIAYFARFPSFISR